MIKIKISILIAFFVFTFFSGEALAQDLIVNQSNSPMILEAGNYIFNEVTVTSGGV